MDWFSFGMLLYHLISGLLPFHDLQSSLETRSVVTAGGRPNLIYPDYSILPRFAHLEGLMKWCWMDSPADRPTKEEVLHYLRDASFLCLRHSIELESEEANCLYSPTSSQTEEVWFIYSSFFHKKGFANCHGDNGTSSENFRRS